MKFEQPIPQTTEQIKEERLKDLRLKLNGINGTITEFTKLLTTADQSSAEKLQQRIKELETQREKIEDEKNQLEL